MSKKVIFISSIDFKSSIAGAVRMRMYSKVFSLEKINFEYYSLSDYPYVVKGKSSYIRKFFNLLKVFSYIFSFEKFIKKQDVIFYYYPAGSFFFVFFVVVYLKIIKKQKIFLEVNEVRRFSTKLSAIDKLKYLFDEFLSIFFDSLVCISTNIKQYYIKYNSNLFLLPILSDIDEVYENHCTYKKGEVFKIGLTGSIHIEKENLKVIFNALSKVRREGYDIEFNLYGIMYNIELFEGLIDEYELSEIVKYYGNIEHNRVLETLRKQDLLILPRARNLQNTYGFSTKLSEYLISGVPVLLTDVSDNLYYLASGVDCFVAEYDSPESFKNKIIFVIDNYKQASFISKNAYMSADKHFNYKKYSKSFLYFLGLVDGWE